MDFNSYAEASSMAGTQGNVCKRWLSCSEHLQPDSGVGLFFQQDVPGIIFVSSVVPGAAAARSGIVKKGDIVIKVNYDNRQLYLLVFTSDHQLIRWTNIQWTDFHSQNSEKYAILEFPTRSSNV